jgi:RHS repeat-associated protein
VQDTKGSDNGSKEAPQSSFQITPPAISLPKGGGAIRGIGEKFSANPVTGTGSMSLPIPTSPGRSGFGPQLSLSYDSGAGNGPFGLGWNLSLSSITRKTDKGLPRYNDLEGSDVFILSGAEDLVPVLNPDGNRYKDTMTAPGYTICRYRPRIEGLFARIERWTNSGGVSHWRSISKDNITTLYGFTDESRIVDPADETRIFSWLICESYDDKGNAISYEYKKENSQGIDRSSAHEANRQDAFRTANRYPKRIKYGNKSPRQAGENLPARRDWMFEVVFDYGEHYVEDADGEVQTVDCADDLPLLNPRKWHLRQDPFSSHRAGFEVRTYRLCQRVLMFHHFESELGTPDYLVRATHFAYSQSAVASFITGVTQSGYKRNNSETYRKKSLPPVEFTYSQAVFQEAVHDVDPASLENLPQGLDNSRYRWVDLDGEGLSGLLTEQGGAWFYKRNQSAVPVKHHAGKETTVARFAPLERVATMPSSANLSGSQQLMDLVGNGQLDVVDFEGPAPGFFERTTDEEWETHRPFISLPNIAWRDPNLKFIDLTGDGHADILITEDQAFTWYQSMAEAGFGSAENVRQPIDEEQGPRLVFADGTQSIYLADMSGDGLTDLVRIRNGEVCYWPNLGYGRFGAKVTMDRAPWFDTPDMFDQHRIRLADIDGSGLVDILYLTGEGVQLYFNQSGNAWSERHLLSTFQRIDNLSAVSTVDLLGNGTACLVWSSPLPGDARSTIRYIDLMGGQKPHLLIKTRNNLGGETEVTYAPSTKFYLQDKQAGKPWITKLPFPVHCVERVTVRDKWRGTAFSSTYSYHHGYFDGIEREFRGFGRVEQRDVETYGKFMQGNIASPYITDQHDLYQPPIKTITWYHTGAAIERDRILSAFKHEYVTIPGFTEHPLPEPTLTPADLSAEEWRQALRACKGMVLRQEIFELDVDALVQEKEVPVRLYTTAYHNSHITRLQLQGINRHAVFLVTESEALTYTYELDLRQTALSPDPRIAHTLNLRFDSYGRAQQSVAVVYPRLVPYADPTNLLTAEQRSLIRSVQSERHIAYTETHFTAELPEDLHRHRLPAPCEVLTYELTDADSMDGFSPSANGYFTFNDLRAFTLSDTLPGQGAKPVVTLAYHQQASSQDASKAHKRIVEWVRMLYFKDDLTGPEPFGTNAWLGLSYETYKLALTRDLLNAVFGAKLTPDVIANLNTATISGYAPGTALSSTLTNQYWMRSGVAGFANDAARHFYLPEQYTDSFGNSTILEYDSLDLYVRSSSDALGNTVSITRFDCRVLAPLEMVDPNGNHTEVYFDILGMVVASAVKGKGTEGDDLTGFDDDLAIPSTVAVQAFCTESLMNEQTARAWLDRATARFVYHFGEGRDANGNVTGWAIRPAGACGIVREIHAAAPGGINSPLQVALECSDGTGNVLMKKVQAEPAPGQVDLRWSINGLTVLNNKGKPVKQYEPAFSDRFGCEIPQANGVTSIRYYDAAGRVMRTEMPDGSYSRVEFSPWQVKTFDANDTVLESGNSWYAAKSATTASPEDQRAARLAAEHADTPAQVHLDSLGREIIAVAHNRVKDTTGNWQDEQYLTFTKLDAEGKPLWIRDARGNLVMQYITPPKANNDPSDAMPSDSAPCYDIAGNLLFQHSMDAGKRWMLMDAAGKPMLAWDLNETSQGNAATRENRFYRTDYDPLHRPTAQRLTINSATRVMVERYEYQDAVANDVNNLNGQLVRHYDPSGRIETIRRDFKGNVQEIRRTLTRDATVSVVNWDVTDVTAINGLLEQETYVQLNEYDALNRMTRLYNWHRQGQNSVAIYLPRYNRRGLLGSEDLVIRATSYDPASGTLTKAIQEIRYNAKGQKTYLQLGNGTVTRYAYDLETFRLTQLRTTRPNQDPSFPGTRANLADQNVLQQLHYTYDPVGNITEIYDEAYKPVFFANIMVEPRSRYKYDALYRLIAATGRENATNIDAPEQFDSEDDTDFPVQDVNALRNYTQRYQYDSVGNIGQMRHMVTSATGGWTRDYAYACDDPLQPASNRLWQTWTGGDRTEAITYGYDTHGNMLNLARIDPRFNLQWDHRDMINSINLGGGGTAYYQYDSGKQRSRKRIVSQNGGGGYWERIYLGGYERYRRYNGNGSTAVEEIESHHLVEGDQQVLLVDDVIVTNRTHADGRGYNTGLLYRYQYSNHLGSACLELDHEAAIISYEEYHSYGTSAYRAMKRDSEAPAKRYRYTGMERDEESGLSYHTARYYVSWLGRWSSRDPIESSDGWNFYIYSICSPLGNSDKSGFQSEKKYADVVDALIDKGAPGKVKDWWNEEAHPNRSKWGAALSENEWSYLASFDLKMTLPNGLNDEQKGDAEAYFGTTTDPYAAYSNYLDRRRIVNHYWISHPATSRALIGQYRLLRDVNPVHFGFERGFQVSTGTEAGTGEKVSKFNAGVEFVMAIAFELFMNKVQGLKPARELPPPRLNGWDLPPEGGGMTNGVVYTEHALERMAGRNMTTLAQLELRAIKRIESMGIRPGTEEFGLMWRKLHPDPRTIPTSVVEAELMRPGSTGLKVISVGGGALPKRVITVIPPN